jgi:hypothetical protein
MTRPFVVLSVLLAALLAQSGCRDQTNGEQPTAASLVAVAQQECHPGGSACEEQRRNLDRALQSAKRGGPNKHGQCVSACRHARNLLKLHCGGNPIDEVEAVCGPGFCTPDTAPCVRQLLEGMGCEAASTLVNPEESFTLRTQITGLSVPAQPPQDPLPKEIEIAYSGNYRGQGPRQCNLTLFLANVRHIELTVGDDDLPTSATAFLWDPPGETVLLDTDHIMRSWGGKVLPEGTEVKRQLAACINALLGDPVVTSEDFDADLLEGKLIDYLFPSTFGPTNVAKLEWMTLALGQFVAQAPSLLRCALKSGFFKDQRGVSYHWDRLVTALARAFRDSCRGDKVGDPGSCKKNDQAGQCQATGGDQAQTRCSLLEKDCACKPLAASGSTTAQ